MVALMLALPVAAASEGSKPYYNHLNYFELVNAEANGTLFEGGNGVNDRVYFTVSQDGYTWTFYNVTPGETLVTRGFEADVLLPFLLSGDTYFLGGSTNRLRLEIGDGASGGYGARPYFYNFTVNTSHHEDSSDVALARFVINIPADLTSSTFTVYGMGFYRQPSTPVTLPEGVFDSVYYLPTTPTEALAQQYYVQYSTSSLILDLEERARLQGYRSGYNDGHSDGYLSGQVSTREEMEALIQEYVDWAYGEGYSEGEKAAEERVNELQNERDALKKSVDNMNKITSNGERSVVAGFIDTLGSKLIEAMAYLLDGVSLFGITLRSVVTTLLVLAIIGVIVVVVIKLV